MKTKLFTLLGFCVVLSAVASFAEACTGITIRAANGDVVFCRTFEWDAGVFPSEIRVSPRNHAFQAQMPDSMPGMSWKGKYGVAGLVVVKIDGYIDAMNEKGLTAGAFYHEGFAEYAEYSKDRADRSISSMDVIPYILSTCENIAEAKQALEKVELVTVEETPMGIPLPLHYMITEPNGKQVVLEYVDGKPKFFDSKIGVITNSPTYDWHLLNLGNYTRLPSPEALERKMGDHTVHSLDTGTDLIGLPGDYTSPSRFVRAAVLSHYARKTPDAKEAVYQAFHVMDSFNVPVYGGDSEWEPGSARSETYWTLAHDLTNRTFYYHTSNDRTVQKVDVSRIDFEKLSEPVHRKLDNGKMTIIDRTDEIERKPIAVLDLYDEFVKKPEAATKAHKGERLTVTGTVVNKGPDPHQKPAIELSPSKDEKSLVLCVVDSFDQLDGVSIGDVITVSGNFYEFWQGKWVVLKQSEVHTR